MLPHVVKTWPPLESEILQDKALGAPELLNVSTS